MASGAAGPSFRVWTYDAPAVVLGRSQQALRDEVAARLGCRARVHVRDAGGGMVLAGPWLVSVSVVLPRGHWGCGSIDEGYRHMAQLHLGALRQLGLRTLNVSKGPAPEAAPVRAGWACFGSVSPWEITDARGRKLVGFAQRRRAAAVLLVAGTLVSAPDWRLLCEAAGRSEDLSDLAARTVECTRLLGQPMGPARLAEALRRRLGAVLEAGLERGADGCDVPGSAKELHTPASSADAGGR